MRDVISLWSGMAALFTLGALATSLLLHRRRHHARRAGAIAGQLQLAVCEFRLEAGLRWRCLFMDPAIATFTGLAQHDCLRDPGRLYGLFDSASQRRLSAALARAAMQPAPWFGQLCLRHAVTGIPARVYVFARPSPQHDGGRVLHACLAAGDAYRAPRKGWFPPPPTPLPPLWFHPARLRAMPAGMAARKVASKMADKAATGTAPAIEPLLDNLDHLLAGDDFAAYTLFEQAGPLLQAALGPRYADLARRMQALDLFAALLMLRAIRAIPGAIATPEATPE